MTSFFDYATLGAERCDLAFEQEEADRRREVFAEHKRQRLHDERARRRGLTLDERLNEILAAIAWAPGRRAGSITRSSRSSEASGLPNLKDYGIGELGHLRAEDVERHLTAIAEAEYRDVASKHIEVLELALDVSRGLAVAHDTRVEDASGLPHAEDVDRRIIEQYAGFSPERIHEIEPSLGKPRAIRWSRYRRGYDRETGEPRESVRAR